MCDRSIGARYYHARGMCDRGIAARYYHARGMCDRGIGTWCIRPRERGGSAPWCTRLCIDKKNENKCSQWKHERPLCDAFAMRIFGIRECDNQGVGLLVFANVTTKALVYWYSPVCAHT